MQNILVTGGTGFLGAHIINLLVKNNYQVVLLKRSTSDTWRISDIVDKIKTYDIDTIKLDLAFQEQQIDAVIHTACCYGRNNEPLTDILNANILFGLKVFSCAQTYSVPVFFNTDTALPKDVNNYSLSKKQFVEWLKHLTGKTKVVNMRFDHMYGIKDDQSKFIPWIIRQLNYNKSQIELTAGEQLRDFIYVDDIVNAYMVVLKNISALINNFTEFEAVNDELITVKEFVLRIVEQYKKLMPNNKTELCFGRIPYRENELMTVPLDNSCLQKLGWRVQVSREQGISNILLGDIE